MCLSAPKEMDSKSRTEFFDGFKPDGKYSGTVGIYRHNESSKHIGVFDAELIKALPDSVGWIAHNGAGYDQIDVAACKEKGIATTRFREFICICIFFIFLNRRDRRVKYPRRSR